MDNEIVAVNKALSLQGATSGGGSAHRGRTSLGLAATVVMASAIIGSACGGGASTTAGGDTGGAPPSTTNSVTLTWARPSLNTDGSALSDAAGYRVDYGDSASSLTLSISVTGASNTSTTVAGLSAGTYYFAVTTLNAAGFASSRSDMVSKTVP